MHIVACIKLPQNLTNEYVRDQLFAVSTVAKFKLLFDLNISCFEPEFSRLFSTFSQMLNLELTLHLQRQPFFYKTSLLCVLLL